jgi:hypothetical protein
MPPHPTGSIHPMVTRARVEITRPNPRYAGHVSTISPLPRSPSDAFRNPNWQNAMCDEHDVLIKNKTWTLVPKPPDANVIRSMWLFRHKYLADGTLSRYRARLVANGSNQIEGVDVDETFSPVVKPGTIRTVLSLAISRHWPVHQLDVKNAFLHGDLAETVYMYQPPGFRDPVPPDYVCLLQRSLYGLKQALRAWFQRFANYITNVGFSPSRCDSSLFIYKQGDDTAFLLLYVDDIVLTASSDGLLQQIIASLHKEFAMTDLMLLIIFWVFQLRVTLLGCFCHSVNMLWRYWNEHIWSIVTLLGLLLTQSLNWVMMVIRFLILSYIGVLLVLCSILHSLDLIFPIPYSRFAYICKILESLISMLSSGFCGMFGVH